MSMDFTKSIMMINSSSCTSLCPKRLNFNIMLGILFLLYSFQAFQAEYCLVSDSESESYSLGLIWLAQYFKSAKKVDLVLTYSV